MAETILYLFPESFNSNLFIEEISNDYLLKTEFLNKRRQIYFDTFDWRLYNHNLILFKEQKSYYLESLNSNQIITNYKSVNRSEFRFWWELSESDLKSKIKPVLDIRALLRLVDLDRDTVTLRILNTDKKTVLKVNVETIQTIKNKKPVSLNNLIRLQPIRGYQDDYNNFIQYLARKNWQKFTDHFFNYIMSIIGEVPGSYSSKLSFSLDAQMPAQLAVKKILLHLVNSIIKNENGLVEDWDTEFLHDFRVAIRRTRSILGQIKGVLPKDIVVLYKAKFADLQKSTNRLRDLDVYLLKKQEYLAMLPENLREGLEPLFTRLQNERILELENLIKIIKSDSYQKLINDWQKYLNSNESDSREKPKHANDTIYQLACDIIFKKYRKLVKIGKKISDETTDAEFHLLRIKSKQLRYLIEFFSSLFPPNEISSLIKHLKKLQDILGDYHDLYIQQQNLKHYLKQDDSDSTDSVPYIAAVGGLIAVLHQKQQSIRKNLTGIFREFNKKSERQIYRQLFNPGDRNK